MSPHLQAAGSLGAGCLQGLPKASTGWFFPMDMFGEKFKLAIVVCIIDVLESISIAKALAYKNRYYLKYGPRSLCSQAAQRQGLPALQPAGCFCFWAVVSCVLHMQARPVPMQPQYGLYL